MPASASANAGSRACRRICRNHSPVQVRCGVGSNGLIDVMALDMTSGKMARTEIHAHSGLGEDEIDARNGVGAETADSMRESETRGHRQSAGCLRRAMSQSEMPEIHAGRGPRPQQGRAVPAVQDADPRG